MSIRPIVIIATCLAALAWAGTGVAGAGTEPNCPAAGTALAAGGQGPDDFVAVEEMPKAIKTVPPRYPEAARRKGVEGTVHVQALVGEDGKVAKVKVTKGKGVSPELDKAAVAAVRQWVFTPAVAKGKPVAVWIVVPVKFRLAEK